MAIRGGGCHCGRVRFEVDLPDDLVAIECNCSICTMTSFLHVIVPASRFRLLAGGQDLVDYAFNTGVAKHRFCGHCGVKSFYVPRSHPDGFSVNARCLDGIDLAALRIERFDDANREAATAAIAHLADE